MNGGGGERVGRDGSGLTIPILFLIPERVGDRASCHWKRLEPRYDRWTPRA